MQLVTTLNFKSKISLIIILCSTSLLFGQELKRAAFLGAQLMDLSQADHDIGTDEGVYLPQILPQGSLGKLDVPAGSVLQEINGNKVHSIPEVLTALSGIKAGDDLSIRVFENGKIKSYAGQAVGKPKEQHEQAEVEYGTVYYEDNTLRSLLYLPNGIEQPPVVFFIQGYTCQSIEMRSNNPAKQLIHQWIDQGYAVFLVEKPGMGDSESAVPCMEIDFNAELKAFDMAYTSLQKNSKVDASQIFLFGHSMGGIIAPVLANKHNPAGVMVFGIVGTNWYDYMINIYTEQPLLFGTSEEQIKEDNQYNLPFIRDMLVHKKSNTELVNDPTYGDFLRSDGTAESLKQGYYIARHYTYWQTLADIDVPGAWAKVKAPVLVLHGEYDIQAIHPKYGEMIVTRVNQHGGRAQFELCPKTEHAFLKFESRDELLRVMNDGSYARTFTTHFNAEIGEKSITWMKQQING